MKKNLNTEATTSPKVSVQITEEVTEQLSQMMKELEKIQPAYLQLTSGIELVIKTILSQAGHKAADIKDLSLDKETWTLNFTA